MKTRTCSILLAPAVATCLAFPAIGAPLYSEDFEGAAPTVGVNGQGGSFSVAEFPALSGNNVGLLTDSTDNGSGGTSSNATTFTIQLSTGTALVDAINSVLAAPVTDDPVEFFYRYDVERFAASSNPVVVNTSIEFLGGDRPVRFPTGEPKLFESGTAATDYDTDGVLELIDATDSGFEGYNFTVTPSGGTDSINALNIRFVVRVNNGATAETLALDNIEIGIVPEPGSLGLIGLGGLLMLARRRSARA